MVLKTDARLETGTIIASKYELLEVLGEGGWARVYKAQNPAIGKQVAIKLLHERQQHARAIKVAALAMSTLLAIGTGIGIPTMLTHQDAPQAVPGSIFSKMGAFNMSDGNSQAGQIADRFIRQGEVATSDGDYRRALGSYQKALDLSLSLADDDPRVKWIYESDGLFHRLVDNKPAGASYDMVALDKDKNVVVLHLNGTKTIVSAGDCRANEYGYDGKLRQVFDARDYNGI